LSVQIIQKSRGAALAIESAQEDVADAIRRGVVGAAEFQAALDNTAKQLSDAQKQLQRTREDETLTPEQREAAVRQAEGRVRDIENRRDAINERSREIRLGRTVGGERATDALSSLQGNERFVNESAGLTARLASAVDAELQARREYEQAIATGSDAEQEAARQRLAAAQQVSESAAAMAEAMLSAESAINRIRDVLSGSLSASERLADDAQKRLTSDPTEENRLARDDAERRLIEDRRRVADANSELDFRRSQASRNDPVLRNIDAELVSITEERGRLEAAARVYNEQVEPVDMFFLARAEAGLLAAREARLLEVTEVEREEVDVIAAEIDARRRLIEEIEKERQFDEQARSRESPVGDALRGLDLLGTSAERAARGVEEQVADITSAFDELVRGLFDATGGLPDAEILGRAEGLRKELADGLSGIFSGAARSAAPAIAEIFDAVQNAVAQGPSRAALSVADVSTSEGSRELTRLLRGDDAARNVNIAQLEKQNQSLVKIIEVMTKVEQKMGIVIDLK
jgi:myosin heavy subunit